MEDDMPEATGGSLTKTRPSLAQLRMLISYIEKHPELSNKKQRLDSNNKYKRQWLELTNNLNRLDGVHKTLKGWIKFWADKKRFTMTKKKFMDEGRMKSTLSILEHKILDLCDSRFTRKKKVKQEPCIRENDDEFDEDFEKTDNVKETTSDTSVSVEVDLKQLMMIEKMVGVMGEQASALSRMAQASVTNSKALERIAEASHVQATAVERLVGTFETISTSAHDIRNAIIGIDYTLKRCYPPQQRQNTTLFT